MISILHIWKMWSFNETFYVKKKKGKPEKVKKKYYIEMSIKSKYYVANYMKEIKANHLAKAKQQKFTSKASTTDPLAFSTTSFTEMPCVKHLLY